MKYTTLIILSGIILLSSCKKKGCTDPNAQNYVAEAKKDDGSCVYQEVPSTYSFKDSDGNSTVSYSGQTERLDQFGEMGNYMESAEGAVISADVLKAMFRNTGGNGGGNFSFNSEKQLANKCFPSDTTMIIQYLDSLAIASVDFAQTASNGQAGTLTSGTSTYLFSANGWDYAEVIEKSVMGGVFFYQATQIYFGSDEMDVDNTTAVDPGNGEYFTSMEHHWDEAFGYFGVPVDFPVNLTGIRYWGKYCNNRDAQLNSNSIMMNAFLSGRTAIVNKDYSTRDASINTIRVYWEKIAAAQALHYLTEARDNWGVDDAKCLHELSEAYAFIKVLKYAPLETRIISNSQIDDLVNNVIGPNAWLVTYTDFTTAMNQLSSIYGF